MGQFEHRLLSTAEVFAHVRAGDTARLGVEVNRLRDRLAYVTGLLEGVALRHPDVEAAASAARRTLGGSP